MNDAQLDDVLKQMAAANNPQLPSAGQIWFRAEIQRKIRQRQRIERPLLVMRGIAAAVCLVIVAVLAFWNLSELRQALGCWYLFPLALAFVAVLTTAALAWSALEPRQQSK
jgi:hypothetical protein